MCILEHKHPACLLSTQTPDNWTQEQTHNADKLGKQMQIYTAVQKISRASKIQKILKADPQMLWSANIVRSLKFLLTAHHLPTNLPGLLCPLAWALFFNWVCSSLEHLLPVKNSSWDLPIQRTTSRSKEFYSTKFSLPERVSTERFEECFLSLLGESYIL